MKRTKLAWLLVVVAVLLTFGCKDDKESSDNDPKPWEGPAVMDITIKGDDMAKSLGYLWTTNAENDGTKDAKIDDLLNHPDDRELKTVVLFVGIHDIASSATIENIISDYIKLYGSINADKIICVSVPPVYGDKPYNSQLWTKIFEFNEAVKVVCRDNYVDTWEITYSATDGIYPDYAMNNLIKAKVDALAGTTSTETPTEADVREEMAE